MAAIEQLEFLERPRLHQATMILALTGWMDGGFVSTGTVRRMMEDRPTREIARIDPDLFYIYNFPGNMEVAALFRPTAKYVGGVISEIESPTNIFHCDESANLVFFLGQEPNLRWQAFADCVFAVAHEVGVERIIFIGSFGGTVPHTRDPRLFGSVSHEQLRPLLEAHGIRLSDYEGPAGFSTYLLAQSPRHKIEMLSLVAEIPGYLQGVNPLSIEAVTRRLAALMNQPVNLDRLRTASNEWEAQVTEAVAKDDELAGVVRKLEHQYDNELIGVHTEEHFDDSGDAEEHADDSEEHIDDSDED